MSSSTDIEDIAFGTINDYISNNDWRVRENSNATYSLQGLMTRIASEQIKNYWLKEIYTPDIREAVQQNRLYIHDRGSLSSYCCGWSLMDLLTNGFGGVQNKVNCRPAKHFNSALNQMVNFLFTLQGELAGAQAFSNVDTLLAPFIRSDELTYMQVYKYIQNFVYSLNVPTRAGYQAPFTNISLDLKCPRTLANTEVIIGGKNVSGMTYSMFRDEMTMFNKAFCQVMLQGDASGAIFSFPIPTYSISPDFEWDSPDYDVMWQMTAKYGTPYFANFANSSLNPDDFRSMCCRLRLDVTKLHTRNGGLFGSAPLTGSLGVVTINLPHLAIESRGDLKVFSELMDGTIDVAAKSLALKRDFVEKHTDALYPYCARYLRAIKGRTGKYWSNHFNTIGIIGCDDAFHILFDGKGVADMPDMVEELILNPILAKLQKLQAQYEGSLFNLEATPCESACYELAKNDREMYPNAEHDLPNYYTNSTMLPPNTDCTFRRNLDIQSKLQSKYTGGTVFHIFTKSSLVDGNEAKKLVKNVLYSTNLPYVTLSPTFTICEKHGYMPGEVKKCCGAKLLVYSRIVGYYRPVGDWNIGKKQEFEERTTFDQYAYDVEIAGIEYNDWVDYPESENGNAVFFLRGCNLKCPWCHNCKIAWKTGPNDRADNLDTETMIAKTRDVDVVISGGEPTVQPKLVPFLRELRRVNSKRHIKLDTNGTNPDVLEEILSQHLVDAVAIDIKSSPEHYSDACGGVNCWSKVKASLDLLAKYKSDVETYVRTTNVPHYVTDKDIETIKSDCIPEGAKWTLQDYVKSEGCDDDLAPPPEYSSNSPHPSHNKE